MKDHGPVLGSGWIHLASTIILGLGIFLAYQWWKNPLLHQAAVIALAVGVIPWAINIFRFVRLRHALGTADLHLQDKAVPMGYSGTATYARPMRGAEVRAVEARLQCEEQVVKGKSERNKTRIQKIIYDEQLAPVLTPMMERLEARLPIRIPASGPPSLTYEEASITWWIRLRLRMTGCPNTASSFQIDVLPAVKP